MAHMIPDLKGGRAHERGSLLITVSMVIIVMLLLAIPFLVKLSAENRSTERASRALAALNLAEAGVDKAVWDLNMSFTSLYDRAQDTEHIAWNADGTAGTITDLKSPDNTVSGDVAIVLEPDPDPLGMTPGVTRRMESTGLVPFIANRTVDRTVGVVLERYFGSIFDYGFVIDEYFRITNTQLTVDSYDSRVANYDPRNPGDAGIMCILDEGTSQFIVDQGGGGTINVTGGLYAGSDAITDGDPNTNPTDALADTVIQLPKQLDDSVPQYGLDSTFNLPEVDLHTLHPRDTWPSAQDISYWFDSSFVDGTELPAWSQVGDSFKGGANSTGRTLNVSGSTTLTEANNGIYSSFIMADGATATIGANQNVVMMVSDLPDTPGGTVDIGHFSMGQGANIILGEGATLTLILGRTSFYMGHMSTINVPLIGTTDQPGTPGDCLILGMDAFDPSLDPNSPLPASLEGDISKKLGGEIVKDHNLSPLGAMVFEQQVDIAAAMYTPHTRSFDLQGMNHADIYGCWIANSAIFKVAAGFHYDLALGDVITLPGGPAKWRIVSWQEKLGN